MAARKDEKIVESFNNFNEWLKFIDKVFKRNKCSYISFFLYFYIFSGKNHKIRIFNYHHLFYFSSLKNS